MNTTTANSDNHWPTSNSQEHLSQFEAMAEWPRQPLGMMEQAKGFPRANAYMQLPGPQGGAVAHAINHVVATKIESQANADSVSHGDAGFAYFNKI